MAMVFPDTWIERMSVLNLGVSTTPSSIGRISNRFSSLVLYGARVSLRQSGDCRNKDEDRND